MAEDIYPEEIYPGMNAAMASMKQRAEQAKAARMDPHPPFPRKHAPPFLCSSGAGWGEWRCGRPLTAAKLCTVCNAPTRLWREDGIDCAIVRHPASGVLCGYARVPEDHIWYGLDVQDPAPVLEDFDMEKPYEQAVDDHGAIPVFLAVFGGDEGIEKFTRTLAAQVPVHGGLNYSGRLHHLVGIPRGHYIGFDCGHSGDAVDPQYDRTSSREFNNSMREDYGYHVWTVDEVELEVKRMAAAIREAWVGRG